MFLKWLNRFFLKTTPNENNYDKVVPISIKDSGIVKLLVQLIDKQIPHQSFFGENTTGFSKNINGNVCSISIDNVNLKFRENELFNILTEFDELYEVSLTACNISDLSNILSLKKVNRLILSDNQIEDIQAISHLQNIKYLNLAQNKITDITPFANLHSLLELNLDNNFVTDIFPICELRKLSYVAIEANPVTNPPIEISFQGIKAIRKYFEATKNQGEEKLYEAKIVIVGAGESGKTTLIRKLINPTHPVPNIEDRRTEGINVTSYIFKGNINNEFKNIHAHIWDFGGQELYHTTHQLFLTADTLYILLNDNRKNDTDFYYWLNIVTIRAGEKCPILLIFNAKDSAIRQIFPTEEIFKTFPNLIRNAIDINFADKEINEIARLKSSIEEQFLKLDILGKPFPSYWVKVREALDLLTVEHISWAHFSRICIEKGISDNQQMNILASTLHNLGVILYFPDVFGLENLIILKSQWCIDAIYAALDTKAIIKSGGKFNETILAEKWSGTRFVEHRLQLLKLMQHFDLCYEIDGTNNYLAPQLLPIEQNKFKNFPMEGTITFSLDYTFMPAGLITRLIARMSKHIKKNYAWRTGVILEWDNSTMAEIIEYQLSHKIVIRVTGFEKKWALSNIRKNLNDLHKGFKGIKYKELIHCNCRYCLNEEDATTYSLLDLEDDAQHGDMVKCLKGERKKIPAQSLLEGIEYQIEPRVFISYSHKNENFKNEFRTMLRPLERENNWKVWDDRWLLPSDKWNNEILKYLSEANVIVLMLTSDFFNSDFCYNIELSRALYRHETGEALLIGIIVSDCLWEETPLKKIQMLPRDGKPIERHENRNEIWKSVVNSINEVILTRRGQNFRKTAW